MKVLRRIAFFIGLIFLAAGIYRASLIFQLRGPALNCTAKEIEEINLTPGKVLLSDYVIKPKSTRTSSTRYRSWSTVFNHYEIEVCSKEKANIPGFNGGITVRTKIHPNDLAKSTMGSMPILGKYYKDEYNHRILDNTAIEKANPIEAGLYLFFGIALFYFVFFEAILSKTRLVKSEKAVDVPQTFEEEQISVYRTMGFICGNCNGKVIATDSEYNPNYDSLRCLDCGKIIEDHIIEKVKDLSREPEAHLRQYSKARVIRNAKRILED